MTTTIVQRGPLPIPRARKVPQQAIIVTATGEQKTASLGGPHHYRAPTAYLISRLDIGDEIGHVAKTEVCENATLTLERLFYLAKRKRETWAIVLGCSAFLRSALQNCEGHYADLEAKVWVDAGTPSLALLTHGGRSLWLVDIRNYCSLDYRELASDLSPATGITRMVETQYQGHQLHSDMLHAKVSSAAWSILSYMATVYPDAWSGTAAGVGWNVWLRYFNAEPLICHDCPEAANLESRSLFGGRVECFRLGEVTTDVYRVDRTCHYPASAISARLPVQLLHSVGNDIQDWGEKPDPDYSACAAVEISCNDHCYPVRLNGQPQWCHGRYLAYLCGEELQAALQLHCVKRVRQAFVYKTGRPLLGVSTALMEMRKDAKLKQQPALAAFAKRAANGLYGRLLRKERVWQDAVNVSPPVAAGEWYKCRVGQGKPIRCMTVRGKTKMEVGTRPHDESHLACGGHLLAAARCTMDTYMRIAARDQVYYLCCDGLHLTRTGYTRLMSRPELLTDRPGGLRLEGIASTAYYRGIYDYDCGNKSVHAGVPRLVGPDGIPVSAGTKRQAELYKDQWDRRDPILVLEHATGNTRARYEGLVHETGWVKTRQLYGDGID